MTSHLEPLPRLDLFLAAAVVTVAILPAFMTGALAVQLRTELGTTPAMIGLAVGVFFAVSALCSTPTGHLVERIGATWGMRICAAGSALVLGAVALSARSPAGLVGILAAGGAVNALSNPSGNLLLARTMPAGRRGLVFGIKQSAIPVGTFLAGLTVPGLALTVGWRWAFLAGAVAGSVLALSVPDRPAAASVRRRSAAPATPPGMSTPALAALASAAALAIFGGQALGAFLVSFGVEAGIGEGAAGWLLSLGSLAGILSRVGSGWVVDLRGGDDPRPGWGIGAAALLLVLGTAGFALLATGAIPLIWVAGPLAFAGGWGWSGLLTYAVVEANPSAPAASTGILQTGIFVGASIGPPLFGVLVEAISYRVAWLTVAAAALGAVGILVALRARLARTPALGSG